MSQALEAWADDVRETIANEVRDNLIKRKSGMPLRVLQSSFDFADGNIGGIFRSVEAAAQRTGAQGIACCAGCSACCHVRVSVMPPEAFHLARHVNETFTPEERAALMDRLRAYVDSIAALPVEARMKHVLACPFLNAQGSCSVYTARPLACRMHHSRSRAACEDANSPIPVIEDFVNATIPVMEGICNGCAMAGMVPDELEFAPAMIIALEQPDAEDRWLAGENVFTNAVDLYLRAYVAKLLLGEDPKERRL